MTPSDWALSHTAPLPDDGPVRQLPDGTLRWMSKTSFHGSGWVFSVYDVVQGDGPLRKVPHESREATHRAFVMADGCCWVYAFQPVEERALEHAALERQIDAGVYVNEDSTRRDGR